jgi:hypothetical protein
VIERPSHLSVVDSTIVDLELRFRTLTGREPTALELKVFTRWKVARVLGLPVQTRETQPPADLAASVNPRHACVSRTCTTEGPIKEGETRCSTWQSSR